MVEPKLPRNALVRAFVTRRRLGRKLGFHSDSSLKHTAHAAAPAPLLLIYKCLLPHANARLPFVVLCNQYN